MPDLSFRVEQAEPVLFAAAPLLAFKLHVHNAVTTEPIHAIVLRCQIRIEPAQRSYRPEEQAGLRDLFGEPARWGQTLRGLLWTHCSLSVRAFTGDVVIDLPVPCTFDFNVAATKYFHALEEGVVPLRLLFSGTVFHESAEGQLQAMQIPWEKEALFRLPVRVWRELMDHYYPHSAWLCLSRDVFDRLLHYKIRAGLPTWEQALDSLLGADDPTDPTRGERP